MAKYIKEFGKQNMYRTWPSRMRRNSKYRARGNQLTAAARNKTPQNLLSTSSERNFTLKKPSHRQVRSSRKRNSLTNMIPGPEAELIAQKCGATSATPKVRRRSRALTPQGPIVANRIKMFRNPSPGYDPIPRNLNELNELGRKVDRYIKADQNDRGLAAWAARFPPTKRIIDCSFRRNGGSHPVPSVISTRDYLFIVGSRNQCHTHWVFRPLETVLWSCGDMYENCLVMIQKVEVLCRQYGPWGWTHHHRPDDEAGQEGGMPPDPPKENEGARPEELPEDSASEECFGETGDADLFVAMTAE